MESPCSIHQAGILMSMNCLTLLDKQALYLLVAQGKLPFTLCYPVKFFLTTTLQAAESLLIPTALELVNNSIATQLLQTLAVKGAPLRSCPTGSQSRGHPARVGGLSSTSVNPVFYKLGLQPLTNGTDQPRVYRRTRTMLKIRCIDVRQTRHNYSQSTESEKAQFQIPSTSNEAINYVEHNSVEKLSQDLVHSTKSDTASASLISESEEREEITAETADVPAPAPTPAPKLETVEEQSHTPGSRKSTRKNLGRPASSYSDFYM